MVESLLRRIAGDALGQRTESAERVVDRHSSGGASLSMGLAGAERRDDRTAEGACTTADRRDRILNRLPKITLAEIGHQTLEQAVAEPAGRIRAAAFILLRDMGSFREQEAEEFNDLAASSAFPFPDRSIRRRPAIHSTRPRCGSIDSKWINLGTSRW